MLSATLNWTIGDLTLTSQTSTVSYDKKDWLDPDDSSFAIFTDLRLETFDQIAQEFRLTSASDQDFTWMVGVYWQNRLLRHGLHGPSGHDVQKRRRPVYHG